MPYYTSVIKVSTSTNVLEAIKREWRDKEKQEIAEDFLTKFFPKTKIPHYDLYFHFPKGSLVCIKQSTTSDLLVDCFSHELRICTVDFSLVLRRLARIDHYVIDTIGLEAEQQSFINSLIEASIPGGALLFLVPPLIESFIPGSFRLAFYLGIASLYTIGYALYLWRKEY